MITDLATIAQFARERHDEFEVMRYMLEINEDIISDDDLDAFVERLVQPIIEAIDCTACANCCKSLDVYLTQADAGQISQAIDVSVAQIETRYVDRKRAEKEEEWGTFKQKPCIFLKGKLCSIYDYRPEACRAYPVFTPGFRWSLEDMIEGASLCPIIYNVLDRMADAVDGLYTQQKSP